MKDEPTTLVDTPEEQEHGNAEVSGADVGDEHAAGNASAEEAADSVEGTDAERSNGADEAAEAVEAQVSSGVVNEDLLETERNPLPVLSSDAAGKADPASEPEPAPELAPEPAPEPAEPHPLDSAQLVLERLRARMRAQVLGRDEVIDLVLVALLSDGHVLLEDFPGSGKTTLAKSLGTSIVDELGNVEGSDHIAPFRRIQFTPDLLPSDVTGVSIFDARSHEFNFRYGPIFAHVVLADEINRTSPKVQSAMLEAMAEKQVTVDNITYELDPLFFVIATQNPLDLAGTYPLPVAQLDRFLFKIRMEHIDRDSELEVLSTWRSRRDVERIDLPRVSRDQVLDARRALDEFVAIDPRIQEALVDIARHIREDERVLQGCSTRSLVLMLPALQAQAALDGRDYVIGDDIAHLAPRVLGHRLELVPGLSQTDEVIDDAVARAIEGLSQSTLKTRTTLKSDAGR